MAELGEPKELKALLDYQPLRALDFQPLLDVKTLLPGQRYHKDKGGTTSPSGQQQAGDVTGSRKAG